MLAVPRDASLHNIAAGGWPPSTSAVCSDDRILAPPSRSRAMLQHSFQNSASCDVRRRSDSRFAHPTSNVVPTLDFARKNEPVSRREYGHGETPLGNSAERERSGRAHSSSFVPPPRLHRVWPFARSTRAHNVQNRRANGSAACIATCQPQNVLVGTDGWHFFSTSAWPMLPDECRSPPTASQRQARAVHGSRAGERTVTRSPTFTRRPPCSGSAHVRSTVPGFDDVTTSRK